MRAMQEDIRDAMEVLLKDDDSLYKSNPNEEEEEPTTITVHTPLVSDEQYANITWSAEDNPAIAIDDVDIVDGGEESDNNPTARPSTEDDRSDTGESTQESHGNEAYASHNDGVEYELNLIPTAQEHRFIIGNTKTKSALHVGLHKAALKGDWKTAKSIFAIDSSAATSTITDADETPLHIAAALKHISFVENLVQLASPSDLAAKTDQGYTALHFAAITGVLRIAKVMVDKNPDLPNLHDPGQPSPVLMAVAYKRKDMAYFLFSKTDLQALDIRQQTELLVTTTSSDYYDIALDILKMKPELAVKRNKDDDTALHVLARKPSAVGSSGELSFWKRHINSRFNGIYNRDLMETLAHQIVERLWKFVVQEFTKQDLSVFVRYPSRLLHDAAKVGNAEFLIILIRLYPDLIWKVDDNDKSIFHTAAENRQESVFSLIYDIGGFKDFIVNYHDREKSYNILHSVGTLAAPHNLSRVSGAALQMQRELFWFKEVEKIVISTHHQMRCSTSNLFKLEIISDQSVKSDHLTPHELFIQEHKQLMKTGEEWMKNTANSCMLVATLIATVVFAAAFTVPGGNDGTEGTPIFRQDRAFTIFVISDVTALTLSATSILTFLSILTSRYEEADFLVSLPTKLLVGLLTLFVSIACMVVAFSATFFIAYDKTKARIPLAIAAVAIIPIGCFCVFHFKLVVDILRSVYWFKFSLKRRKRRLFQYNCINYLEDQANS